MSRVVETRVKINVEAAGAEQARATIGSAAESAKNAQQAFIGLQNEQAETYAGIASVTQDAEGQVQSLTEAVAKLRSELSTLPDSIRATADAVLNSLQTGDLQTATALRPQLAAAPPELRRDLDSVAAQTLELSKTAPAALPRVLPPTPDQGGLVPPTTPPVVTTGGLEVPEPVGTIPRTSERGTEKPVTLLRNAYKALQDNDLEAARTFGTRAARAAIADEDSGAFGVATEIPGVLREAEQRENGLESQRRYDKTLSRLETRLKDLEAPPDSSHDRAPSLGGASALGRAARTLSGIDAHLEGGIRRPSEINDLSARLGRAGAYLTQAEKGGAPDPQLTELRDQLAELTAALEATKESFDKRPAEVTPPGPRQPEGDTPAWLESVKGLLGGEAQRVVGTGLGQAGTVGRVAGTLGKLGPIGAAAAAAVGALKAGDTFILDPAREAAEDYRADVDLARQYGATYSDAPDGDPVDMFRDRATGLSYDELVKQGYTAADASRVMAQLDLVNGGRVDTAIADTYSVLEMSRSTGLDEGRLTNTARTLGTMADFGRGEVGNGLELLKAAMTEGVAAGVSKADTLQALVGIVEEGFRDGHVMTERGLAFQAALVGNLAATGNRLFQGDNASKVATGLVDFATGAGAPEMTMLLAPKIEELGGIDALNLDPQKPGDKELLNTLTTLEAQGATFARDELILSNIAVKAPELLPELTETTLGALAGNRDLELQMLMRYGNLNLNEAAQVAGGDMKPLIAKAAAGLEPEDLTLDTRGDNTMAAMAEESGATTRDTKETRGYGFMRGALELALDASRLGRNVREGWRTAVGVQAEDASESIPMIRWLRNTLPGVPDVPDDVPMPLPDATGTYTPPPIQPDPQPPEAPDAAIRPARNYAEGLYDLGSKSVTTYPGETYGESLRGTPAEFLIGTKHRGADLRIGEAGRPDPIHSPWDRAKVIDAGESDSYGHWLRLEAENGSKWEMGHLQNPTDDLMGKTFRRGDRIAMEGSSGASTGYHLDLRAYDTEDPALRAINQNPVQFWERFQNSLTAPDKTAAAPEKKRLDIHIHGLNDIRVQGVGGQQAATARAALNAFVAAITEPEGHKGFA